jgi:hypothetical protein
MEGNTNAAEIFVIDTTVVLGTVIDTHTTVHPTLEDARDAFSKSLDGLIDSKYLVRLFRIEGQRIEEIAHYRNPS